MGAAKKHGPAAYLGIDVGKSRHSACALDAAGGVVFRADLDNRPGAIDRLLERAGDAALVVVDQKRNIGALVLARAHALGRRCAYLPGYAEKRARDMMPGIAKTDAIDAEAIARTAMGMPQALRPIAAEDAAARSLRALSSQREYAVASRTRAKNRFRAVLLEAGPELGRRGPVVAVADGGALRARRRAGAPAARAREPWEALDASAGSGRGAGAGEDVSVRMLAREISALDSDVAELDGLIGEALAGDEVYESLLTIPGIGPKTAAALVTAVDISLFGSYHELASYCGVAPADSRSGTSIRSTSPQRGGNKHLKNLLIFSCNSLVGTDNRFGRYYDECRARGMRHNKALKAVARKRMKVVYAVMWDAVPYEPRR